MHKNSREVSLRAVILEEDGNIVIQCLDHDIAVQSKSMSGALIAFHVSLAAHVSVADRDGLKPFSNIKPAPAFYVYKFNNARKRTLETDNLDMFDMDVHVEIANDTALVE